MSEKAKQVGRRSSIKKKRKSNKELWGDELSELNMEQERTRWIYNNPKNIEYINMINDHGWRGISCITDIPQFMVSGF